MEYSFTDIQTFRGTTNLDVVYSENSREIRKAVQWLGIPHRCSVPGSPATNALAESRVNIVVYGTRTSRACAGLPSAFWPYAAQNLGFVFTIAESGDRKSAYERQLGEVHRHVDTVWVSCVLQA